jgi:hypothetical protein
MQQDRHVSHPLFLPQRQLESRARMLSLPKAKELHLMRDR